MQLLSCLINPVAVCTVDNKNEALSSSVIMAPKRTDLVLTSNIPYGETNVLVLYGLNIEANCWNGVDNFAKLELVENGGLTGGVKTDLQNTKISPSPLKQQSGYLIRPHHEDSHLLLPEEPGKQPRH